MLLLDVGYCGAAGTYGMEPCEFQASGALVTPCWAAAAGQHYPAPGATASFARNRLSPQPAKVQMHKALRYQQLSTVGSFSFDNSAFVFRLRLLRQVSVVVSVASQQASGGLGVYGVSRRNLLSVAQQH